MTKATITSALVRGLAPLKEGAAKHRIFDDRLAGFIAEQRPSGVTLYIRYRDERGRTRELKLGRAGQGATVEQLRRRAEQVKAEVSLGGDPLGERDKRRAVPTLAAFIEERYLPHTAELRSAGNIRVYCRRIKAALGKKPLDQISALDVADLRKRVIADGLSNSSVNRHLATIRSLMNLARRWGLVETPNPASSPGMLPERGRDRYLGPAETRALVKALEEDKARDAAAALVLLIVTGARKREVTRATWDLVDFDRGTLEVPRSKNGRTRHIPLSPVAVALLRGQEGRKAPENPHVFPGAKPKQPVENLRGPWERAKKRAGLPAELRIHDLRHSFASALANAGIPLTEIGVILGHRSIATSARYTHHAPQRMIETASVATRSWDLALATPAVEPEPGK